MVNDNLCMSRWNAFYLSYWMEQVGLVGGVGNSGNSVALLAETRKTTGEAADNCK